MFKLGSLKENRKRIKSYREGKSFVISMNKGFYASYLKNSYIRKRQTIP